MEVHQIVLRPHEDLAIVLYDDLAGGRQSLTFSTEGNAQVDAVVALCQAKLPSDANNPAKLEIQNEIARLESRLTQLKDAIGV